MISYKFIKKMMFLLPPEIAHSVGMTALSVKGASVLQPSLRKIMGKVFENRVGIAAGFDKNGDYIRGLEKLGIGFAELGTVTRYPQKGNPKPRLARLTQIDSLVNRMGFNNKGVDHITENLTTHRLKSPNTMRIGVSIGPNKGVTVQQGIDDLLYCWYAVDGLCDYVAVNISSPNTAGLQSYQNSECLKRLLDRICAVKSSSSYKTGLVVKVPPNLTEHDVDRMCSIFEQFGIDGVITTNTMPFDAPGSNIRNGGMSGAVLAETSRTATAQFCERLAGNSIRIISSGGVMTADEAVKRVDLGADLIQVYTGLVYKGPNLLQEIATSISEL